MKTILFIVGLLMFGSVAAQEPSVPIIAEVEIEEVSEKYNDTQQDVTKATKDYADAVKDYNKAKEELIKYENAMEKARMDKKSVERALTAEQKRLNPVVISRYEVNINPVLEDMSRGSQYGYSMYLIGSESSNVFNLLSKNVDSEFKKFMKTYDSAKVKKSKGELLFDDVFIPEISSNRIDMYTDFKNEDNGVVMKAFFNVGHGFLDTNAGGDAAEAAKNLLDRFARHMRTIEVESELKDQEKELKKYQNDLEKARKDIINAREDIGKNETRIAENRLAIDENETLAEQQLEAIEITRRKLAKIN